MNPLKHVVGYVTQENILEEEMTVRETFEMYSALRRVKQPTKWSQEIIDKLKLRKCADTKIGGTFVRGISGGEKKRTSIGVELVSSPSLLFLDEPTTGLDSATALEVMQLISNIKKQDNMTIISILHQPSSELLELFDKVIVLCDGMIVFDGKPQEIKSRLCRVGLEMPKFSNAAEFFLKSINKEGIHIELEKDCELEQNPHENPTQLE